MAQAQNPLASFLSFTAIQDPSKAFQIQQQQMLAQQLMEEGDKGIDPLRTAAGGVAVPISPFEGLAGAAKKISGAYLQKDSNQKLADMLSGGASNSSGSALGNAVAGNQSFLPPGMNMQTAMQISALPSEALQKAALDRWMMTNEQKNAQDPVLGPGTVGKINKDAVGSFDYNGRTGVPMVFGSQPGQAAPLQVGGAPGPQASTPQAAPNPAPAPSIMPNGQADNAAIQAMTGYDSPAAIPGASAPMASPITNAPAPQVNQAPQGFGIDPIQQAKDKAIADSSGKNIADADKSVASIDSRIDNAKSILQSQIDLAPKTFEGSMGENQVQPLVENWKNLPIPDSWKPAKYGDPSSQYQFEQNNANLALQSMSGLIPPGSRLDIPIVKMIQTAEQIPPYAPKEAKIAVAQNQMKMLDYAKDNLFKNAALMKELSMPEGTPLSPQMQAINNEMMKIKNSGSSVPVNGGETKTINGVTYTKINGVWHHP